VARLPLLRVDANGLFCEAGNFHIDPWGAVDRAIITHAHSDHAREGSRNYLTTKEGEPLLRARVGEDAAIQAVAYGEPIDLGGVRVSLYPAGHILGSAQVRIERGGEVWVVSGDYKLAPDATCTPFETLRCYTFVTESTFGLPIYRWRPEAEVLAQVGAWWRANREAGKASLLFACTLGKAQRVLAGIDPGIGPIYTHGAIENVNRTYRDAGVALAPTRYVGDTADDTDWRGALILAPPSSLGSPWVRRFGPVSTGFVSGWMRIRGARRRRSLDRGFVLSDHADWAGLNSAIAATGAESVWVTHGYRAPLVQWLHEKGYNAQAVETRFEDAEEEG
jgi:putative mRNA 3-end processing factor